MSGSINKILNDALDQTILNENVELEEGLAGDAYNAVKGRVKATVDSMGKPGYAGGEGAARDNLRKYHPNATTTDPSVIDNALQYAKDHWKAGAGTAAIGAGIGAVMLAKKLRAKKKAAAAKAAKKAKK